MTEGNFLSGFELKNRIRATPEEEESTSKRLEWIKKQGMVFGDIIRSRKNGQKVVIERTNLVNGMLAVKTKRDGGGYSLLCINPLSWDRISRKRNV